MRNTFNLNNHWLFKDSFSACDVQNFCADAYEQVNLPHVVKELPYNCFGQTDCAMVSTYARKLELTEDQMQTVSYTHLDVYKRQAGGCSWQERFGRFRQFLVQW